MEQEFWDTLINLNTTANEMLQLDQQHSELLDKYVEILQELSQLAFL